MCVYIDLRLVYFRLFQMLGMYSFFFLGSVKKNLDQLCFMIWVLFDIWRNNIPLCAFCQFLISLDKTCLFKVILVKVAWYFSCTMAMSAGVCNLETINWHRKEDIACCMILVFTRVCVNCFTCECESFKLWSFSSGVFMSFARMYELFYTRV